MRWELEPIIAVLSVVIPLVAFVWEFAVVRRKRLGYRVQMDTSVTSKAPPAGEAILANLKGTKDVVLNDPSFVLLRVENAGWTEIVSGDYLTDDHDRTGIRVIFPGRRVVDVALSETSQKELDDFFYAQAGNGTVIAEGFGINDDMVRLPKVKLNPRAYYKVLVVLEGAKQGEPEFRADVSGRHNRWIDRLAKVQLDRTESHTFASRPALVGIGLLAAAVLAQSGLVLFRPDVSPPMDCVSGTLTLHGSTAFRAAVTEAADRYVELCRGSDARIPINERTFLGSAEGLNELESSGGDAPGDHLAFSDGFAPGQRPRLLSHPIAYSVYTLVANEGVGVYNLNSDQIRRIFSGQAKVWSDVGGPPNLPIQIIKRPAGSGTRTALEERVLKAQMPRETVNDCAALDPAKPGVCEASTTRRLLELVGRTPGAIGYSEVHSAASAAGVKGMRIDGYPATLDGVEEADYPYWQTEFAYSWGELPPNSIGAAFLRFLRTQEGMDILRKAGNRPCSETPHTLKCVPK